MHNEWIRLQQDTEKMAHGMFKQKAVSTKGTESMTK